MIEIPIRPTFILPSQRILIERGFHLLTLRALKFITKLNRVGSAHPTTTFYLKSIQKRVEENLLKDLAIIAFRPFIFSPTKSDSLNHKRNQNRTPLQGGLQGVLTRFYYRVLPGRICLLPNPMRTNHENFVGSIRESTLYQGISMDKIASLFEVDLVSNNFFNEQKS